MITLGIRIGHDASATLLIHGKIVAEAAEERFSGNKNDSSMPLDAIRCCLKAGAISSAELDTIAVPHTTIPEVISRFFTSPTALSIKRTSQKRGSPRQSLRRYFSTNRWHPQSNNMPLYIKPMHLNRNCVLHLTGHHDAHAASACLTNPYSKKSLVVVLDGWGDGLSVSIWKHSNGSVKILHQIDSAGSLGWFYSNCTEAMEWRHGRDEWKMMGLAPFGKSQNGILKGFYPEFHEGYLKRGHFYGKGTRWNNHGSIHYHFPDAGKLQQICSHSGRENFAAEAQRVLEEQVLNLVIPWIERTGLSDLSCAGGIFLNVKLNQRLRESGKVTSLWVYPNPGDGGLATGAALHANNHANSDFSCEQISMSTGPEYSDDEIEKILKDRQIKFSFHHDITGPVAQLLIENYAVGWFQGRMEAGPRALGNRSILMSPIRRENKDYLNQHVKFREDFRPFCPSILSENASEILLECKEERFMLSTYAVNPSWYEKIPAVVHQDRTTRPQLVDNKTSPLFYRLIQRFSKPTGVPVLLNTSFNIKGKPIVCDPRDAIKCFYDSGLHALAVGSFLIKK